MGVCGVLECVVLGRDYLVGGGDKFFQRGFSLARVNGVSGSFDAFGNARGAFADDEGRTRVEKNNVAEGAGFAI